MLSIIITLFGISLLSSMEMLAEFRLSLRYCVETLWFSAFLLFVLILLLPFGQSITEIILSLVIFTAISQSLARAGWLVVTGCSLDLWWVLSSFRDSVKTAWLTLATRRGAQTAIVLAFALIAVGSCETANFLAKTSHQNLLYLVIPVIILLALSSRFYPPLTASAVFRLIRGHGEFQTVKKAFPITYPAMTVIPKVTKPKSLVILLLESVSSVGMGYQPGATHMILPGFEKYAPHGLFFPFSIAANIQSNRGIHSVLTSSQYEFGVAQSYRTKKNSTCEHAVSTILKTSIPELRSTYIQGFNDRTIQRFDTFIPWLGFDTFVAPPFDPKNPWGDDRLTYSYVKEALSNHNGSPQFILAHLDEAHFPFNSPSKQAIESELYANPDTTLSERYKKAQLIQDRKLGEFLDWFMQEKADGCSLIISSDHSWPTSTFHTNNSFNERNAFNENFMIPTLVIPARSEENLNRNIRAEQFVPQGDIRETAIELVTGCAQRGSLLRFARGNSFGASCAIAVQPFNGPTIAQYVGTKKYVYYIRHKTLHTFDLAVDFEEANPVVEALSVAEAREKLSSLQSACDAGHKILSVEKAAN